MSDQVPVLICSPRGYFSDDVHGECADCGGDIVWRPHAPSPARRVCISCWLGHVRTLSTTDRAAIEVVVTPESRAEADAVIRRGLF